MAVSETSSPIEFVVLLDAARTFLRVLAHLREGVVHGGAPPTFCIQAGTGAPVEVDEGAGPVAIIGSTGATVATATCLRTPEDDDTYLVTIDHSAPSGPWRLRIRNNEPEALTFYGFAAHEEEETRHPWMQFSGSMRLGGLGTTTDDILVFNTGTADLIICQSPGDRLGPEASPATIVEVPPPIAPHRACPLVAECEPLSEVVEARTDMFEHTLATNDPDPTHAVLRFGISPPVRISPPVLPRTRCRENDGCRRFVRSLSNPYMCATCFHGSDLHGLPGDPLDQYDRPR
ncbi:hypothetical protein [Micromonospora sp. NPDC048830]|uniref:hypothetical protein n=1 Tax=Micromonospora sp. NPDC048830 TaxID=3364257 RepID=UPI003716A0EB